MEMLNAARAERMATVHQDPWDALTNVVLESTELADVKASALVVEVHELLARGGLMLMLLTCHVLTHFKITERLFL